MVSGTDKGPGTSPRIACFDGMWSTEFCLACSVGGSLAFVMEMFAAFVLRVRCLGLLNVPVFI